ncbi:hypothetical protein O9G_000950 [Rozella allomycis CSF55]|uniref:Uncharacterized protein n=1 Tax=Rozella allomycis (strain CSF55) TaxID=988480 RepID=A0A075ANA2_ROZAC|nr:hypothetical protein O9G_000950 [Rozella allomycis CSF55]|eukprot:EPZ31305.1 hypothetical protein O9G_000950 [Rozella allomycis CSF55]
MELQRAKLGNSLEHFLEKRPEKDELVNANILKGGIQLKAKVEINVAPNLVAASLELERAKIEDVLAHKLEKRPEKDELVNLNILKGDTAPSLQAVEQDLLKAQAMDKINKDLNQRHTKSDLIENGTPSLQATSEMLKKKFIEDEVNKKLSKRPSIDDQVVQKVIN